MSSTQLGLGSYACAWAIGVPGYEQPREPMDVFAFLRFASELGLRLVQIADNLPLHMLTQAEQQRLCEEARQRGISIEVGTRGILPEQVRSYLEIAATFGSPILRVVVDSAGHHPSPNEVTRLIRGFIPDLEKANITLAIENHDRFKARVLADIIKTVGSPLVGVCLDTVNSFGSLEGPEVVVDTLGPYVVSLHVKEFEIRRVSHNMGFVLTGLPAGQGMLDIPWLLDCLNDFGRTYNAIIETWPAPEATMDETISKELDWARQSVRYLRTLIQE